MIKLIFKLAAFITFLLPLSANAQNASLELKSSSVVVNFLNEAQAGGDAMQFLAPDARFTWIGLGDGFDIVEFREFLKPCNVIALFGSKPKEDKDKNKYLWAALECSEKDGDISRIMLGFALADEKIVQIEMDIFSGLGRGGSNEVNKQKEDGL